MANEDEVNDTHDPQFEPIVTLPEKIVPTLEEDEDVLFKMRAKLFRWSKDSDPPEWKERGTGDMKILKHKSNERIRILMRRDKTFKICANHYLDKRMELVPNCNSDRAWMWNTFADFSEEEPREELLAVRFLNSENANKFKEKFQECQKLLPDKLTDEKDEANGNSASENEDESKTNDVARKLEDLSVKESKDNTNGIKESYQKNEERVSSAVEDSPEK